MNQLTTTNNQFTLDESLMERVFESCGYKFSIIRPKDNEPHFLAKEVADALGYSRPATLVQYFNDNKLDTLVLTKENGLHSIKNMLCGVGVHKRTARLCLIPESSLQEFILRYATNPDAKEVGKKLYGALTNGNPVFNPEVLDD